jgi:putative zinc finger/helix-turn-helix YgiT family protein
MKHVCAFCEVGHPELVLYDETIKAGRRSVAVSGLSKLVCLECGQESVPLDVYDRNALLIESAMASSPAAVSRGLLRRLRESWGITQRDASRLFGAGSSAFGKWESGQADLSTPTALLVQCALKVPGVMQYLASLAKVDISAAEPAEDLPCPGSWHSAPEMRSPTDRGPRLTLVSVNAVGHGVRFDAPGSVEHEWNRSYSHRTELRAAA